MKKREVFVPPEGTRPIPPDKEDQRYYANGRPVHNPPISREDAERLKRALRNSREGGNA